MGLITGLVFLIVFLIGVYIGTRLNKRPRPPDIDENEQREIKQLNDEFQKVMGYNLQTALERKKV